MESNRFVLCLNIKNAKVKNPGTNRNIAVYSFSISLKAAAVRLVAEYYVNTKNTKCVYFYSAITQFERSQCNERHPV